LGARFRGHDENVGSSYVHFCNEGTGFHVAGGLGRLRHHDLADDQAPVASADMDGRAVWNPALEDLLGQRVLQFSLDHPL
jgi:hypothetical protein